jgi:hypothetical protein
MEVGVFMYPPSGESDVTRTCSRGFVTFCESAFVPSAVSHVLPDTEKEIYGHIA